MKKHFLFLIFLAMPVVHAAEREPASSAKQERFISADEVAQRMATGGCHRLRLDATGKNNYGTSPYPLNPVTEISRSSSTSSKPTQAAFEALMKKLHLNSDRVSSSWNKEIRSCLKRVFVCPSLRRDVHVICTPSGTSAEMIVSWLALARSKSGRVSALNVAADEVGSGMNNAATLRHFSSNVPLDDTKKVEVGQFIEGADAGSIELVPFYLRERGTGKKVDMDVLEALLEERIVADIEQEKFVILHIVHAAKTGIGGPRFAFAQRMKQKYRDRLIVKVDAAQGRFSDDYISKCLENNFIVLFTGSKFFGGVSFSGALFIPAAETAKIKEDMLVPAGFKDYFSCHDIDRTEEPVLFKGTSEVLNESLSMRWHTAVTEIEDYYNVGYLGDDFISNWVKNIKKIMRKYPWCVPLESLDAATDFEGDADFVGGVNTIRSFLIKKTDGSFFNGEELKKVCQFMISDISEKLPKRASSARQLMVPTEDLAVAHWICYLGQSVFVSEAFDVLRYVLSAPTVSLMDRMNGYCHQYQCLKQVLDQDEIVLKKLDVIVRNFDSLTK